MYTASRSNLWKMQGTVQQEDIPVNYVMISDHLDMVGVELRATNTQTRMANGDELVTRLKNKVGLWQSGKFSLLERLFTYYQEVGNGLLFISGSQNENLTIQ